MAWPNIADEAEFFQSEAVQLLERAIDFRQDLRFDAIVVDEGQDFQPAWWETIELLNKLPMEGPLYDPDQQIFNNTIGAMPDLGEPFFLPVNCRNTEQIAARCGSIIGKDIPVNKGTPSGRSPRFVHAPTKADQSRAVEQQVLDWVSKTGGLRPDQIAIVTRGKVESSSVSNLRTTAGVPVVDDLARWKGGVGVLLTSLYRFKGLEAAALILVDVDHPDPHAAPSGFRPEHFYVGCSRAKHLLTIIPKQMAGFTSYLGVKGVWQFPLS